MNDCKRSGQIPHAASTVVSATMGSRRVGVVVRAARERQVGSWAGSAGFGGRRGRRFCRWEADGSIRCTDANLTVKPSAPHSTRASSRGTVAHTPARPPSCCELNDCGGLAIDTLQRRVCPLLCYYLCTAAMLEQCSTQPQPQARRVRRWAMQEPQRRKCQPAGAAQFRTRLCLISKSNHHEGYQLARHGCLSTPCAAMMSTMTNSPAQLQVSYSECLHAAMVC